MTIKLPQKYPPEGRKAKRNEVERAATDRREGSVAVPTWLPGNRVHQEPTIGAYATTRHAPYSYGSFCLAVAYAELAELRSEA